jgi:hypothetical protein
VSCATAKVPFSFDRSTEAVKAIRLGALCWQTERRIELAKKLSSVGHQENLRNQVFDFCHTTYY